MICKSRPLFTRLQQTLAMWCGLWVCALTTATHVHAEQFKHIKNVEVHYSLFPSTFLQPDIARHYQLKRHANLATLNISLLDLSQPGKPAIRGTVSGRMRNLIGQQRALTFVELSDGDAIYYITQVPIDDETHYNFELNIDAGQTGRGSIQFNQVLYQQ